MASPEGSEISPALLKVATHVYRFPLPATKLIAFTKCFADNLGAEETSKSISSMEQARDDLANELASGTPNYAQAVAGATRYCPLIAHVLRSLEKADTQVYLAEPLKFTWATGLGERPRQDWIENEAVVWDKCMVLAAQALSYADTVYNMLEDQGTKFNEAGVHLRTAAGIFERLHKVELPRWVGDTAAKPRLVEVEPGICEGLVQFCLAEAQQMAIGKALVAGTTPKTLLARLCEGVRRLLENSVTAMRKGGASSAYEKLDSPFLVHISFQQCMFRGLAYRFLAESAWEKDEYGVGLAYLVQACKYVEERRDAVSVGLPPLAGQLRNIANDLKTLQGEFRELRDSWAQDNNSIYYEPVPEPDMLDPLPQPVVMMKPMPSEEGAPPTKTLSFRATAGNSPEPAGACGVVEAGEADKTDEEMARELHEKLNT